MENTNDYYSHSHCVLFLKFAIQADDCGQMILCKDN